jgi:tRNA(Ile)-lysidine synthase
VSAAGEGGRRGSAADSVEARVRAGGLLERGRPVVVLLSGGRDSVCLLDLAVRLAGVHAVSALHVDYGLRDSAAGDAAACAALCERLAVPLTVRRPARPPRGNLQAWARDVRYAEAERLAARRGAHVAAGHTASDQVETVLYRLAASPGRRAMLGMPAREGRLVRPLLEVGREETAAYCAERGLAWREDPTNASPSFARNRARHDLLPALRSLHPAAEANVLRTLAVLRDEAAVLDALVDGALRHAEGVDFGAHIGPNPTSSPGAAEVAGAAGGAEVAGAAGAGEVAGAAGAAEVAGAVDSARLAGLPPALARLCLQRLADRAAPGRAPAVGPRAQEILALGARGGSAALDLGGGLRAVCEYGRLRFEPAAAAPPAAPSRARLPVPGRAAFAGGELTSEVGADLPVADGTLDLGALAAPLEVRPWRAGDRMRPLGAPGSRSLQDLFTDRRVPRARRARVPVVLSGDEIAWVPGVATGEAFRVTERTRERARLAWHPPPPGG